MLLGTEIHVYMDHMHLTYMFSKFAMHHLLWWHLLLEELRPMFHYNTCATNFITDVLSQVPTLHMEKESPLHAAQEKEIIAGRRYQQTDESTACKHCLLTDDSILADGVLVHPELNEHGHVPTNLQTIYEYQQANGHIVALPSSHPAQFCMEHLGGFDLVCINTDH